MCFSIVLIIAATTETLVEEADLMHHELWDFCSRTLQMFMAALLHYRGSRARLRHREALVEADQRHKNRSDIKQRAAPWRLDVFVYMKARRC